MTELLSVLDWLRYPVVTQDGAVAALWWIAIAVGVWLVVLEWLDIRQRIRWLERQLSAHPETIRGAASPETVEKMRIRCAKLEKVKAETGRTPAELFILRQKLRDAGETP